MRGGEEKDVKANVINRYYGNFLPLVYKKLLDCN